MAALTNWWKKMQPSVKSILLFYDLTSYHLVDPQILLSFRKDHQDGYNIIYFLMHC